MKRTFTLLFAFVFIHFRINAQVLDPASNIESSGLLQISHITAHDSASDLSPRLKQGGGEETLAVPANDNCGNAIALTVGGACVNGTTMQATKQAGENFSCQGTPTQSVWYKFTATATSMYVEVLWTSSSGSCALGSAVWSGSCLPSKNLSCIPASSALELDVHNLTGLTIGTTYYIQVTFTAGGACGTAGATTTGANFCIDVGVPVNCNTCPSPCGGTCAFSATPTVPQVTAGCTPYALTPRVAEGQSRTECYTFKATNTSINLNAVLNSVGCPGTGNVVTFNWTLQSSACGAVLQSGSLLTTLTATGLTIGQSYVTCFTWVPACQYETGIYPYIVTGAPLPIQLIDFQGTFEINHVLLSWITASETNNNFFTTERSSDGIDFQKIGKVKGAGTSTETINYNYTDLEPLTGISYYRLKQTDYDGTETYSSVIAINNDGEDAIKLIPNPARNQFAISFGKNMRSDNYAVEIYNTMGQVIYNQTFYDVSNNEPQIQLSAPKGIYLVRVNGELKQYIQRLIID